MSDILTGTPADLTYAHDLVRQAWMVVWAITSGALVVILGCVYMATRVPSMLGNHGTFDSWLSMLYFGMNLPSSLMRSARTIGLVAGGAAGGPGGMAVGAMAASAGVSAAASGLSSAASMATPSAGGDGGGEPRSSGE